jgi:hypothetical protein
MVARKRLRGCPSSSCSAVECSGSAPRRAERLQPARRLSVRVCAARSGEPADKREEK